MPVLPLVGSSSARPRSSSPAASAVSIIALATRSLIEPVGFCPSSFAYTRTSPNARNSTRGVFPISSSRFGATALGTAGEDVDRRAGLAHCVHRVTGAGVKDQLVRSDVEFHECVVETPGASWLERTCELCFDRRSVGGPERAVELVRGDRHTLPPAIAGSRITVESSWSSVSR